MPRSCSICTHEDRDAIDFALVGGESSGSISARFRSLSEQAIRRHRSNHIPAALKKAHEAEEVADADNLLDQVRDLQARALSILDQAEDAGELGTALRAIREARGNLELLGKLAGELNENPVVNIHLSTEWLELRAVIVASLEPHHEARSAVLRALEGAGDGNA